MTARPSMADATEADTNFASNGASVKPMSSDVRALRNAVRNIDGLSQAGFSEIAAIARLALVCLGTPDGYRHLGNLAHALSAICGKANDIQNCINCEAEEVGCNYVNPNRRRRADAEQRFREELRADAERSVMARAAGVTA